MTKNSVIVITGAAGFIGSCLVSLLNSYGFKKLVLVDNFDKTEKEKNLKDKHFLAKVERDRFFHWLQSENPEVEFIFHLGARTDTTEFNYDIHQHLNVDYTQRLWTFCVLNKLPIVYASSAATYGLGEFGYKDDHNIIEDLQPLNPYGISKNEVDKWVLKQVHQNSQPPFWAGLKFFNVYGPNEYHKGRMASVIFHSFNQIKNNGNVKLFKSHKTGFKDGEQLRDFIYVMDVIKICYWFMETFITTDQPETINGIYNVGTGKARTFNALVDATFDAIKKPSQIVYIDMPEDIRNTYQYFTEAEMNKLKEAGYTAPMTSLEDGVHDYVKNYLSKNEYY
ncbi:MAG: ADP-glyceromanno-heptose 6-epimerase [Ginsengibacter sp.]